MTPLEIRLLLHIHTTPAPIETPTKIYVETLDHFQAIGLITMDEVVEPGQHPYRLTERGQVYIDALMSLPLPVAYWRIPDMPEHRVGVLEFMHAVPR